MTTEINEELKRTLFTEWYKKQGIKRFFVDLDDTICPTRPLISNIMSQVNDFLAEKYQEVPKETWMGEIREANNRLFETYGVNSSRWNYVVDEVGKKFPISDEVEQRVKDLFQLIYKTPLTMLEGAEEGLKFIKEVGLPIGIVTHASQTWTRQKYDWLGLSRFLDWEEVFVVDENGHKTSKEWGEAIKYFGLKTTECAVVGDSPRSDINPVWEIGVRHCFLVEDPEQWSIHNQPINGIVRKIKTLAQIPDSVLNTI